MEPTRQIVLLRGINLGARNRIAMAELRTLFSDAGYRSVRSYLQSGNVVVTSDRPPRELARDSERRIAEAFGLQIEVVVRTRDELAAIIERNPLGYVARDPKRYQVSFLSEEIAPEVADRLAAVVSASERFVAAGRELYAWHPDGVARSKLSAELAGKRLGVAATARNWTTVTSLLALADE